MLVFRKSKKKIGELQVYESALSVAIGSALVEDSRFCKCMPKYLIVGVPNRYKVWELREDIDFAHLYFGQLRNMDIKSFYVESNLWFNDVMAARNYIDCINDNNF